MERILHLFAISIMLLSCNSSSVDPVDEVKLFIDNHPESTLPQAVASQTCDNIYVVSIDFKNTLMVYSLEINLLKSGRIVNVTINYKDGRRFETQAFDASRYITISNFIYNEQANIVSLDLRGQLFTPQSTKFIEINGSFRNLPIKSDVCGRPNNKLKGLIQGPSKSYNVETTNSSTALEWPLSTQGPTTYFQNFYLTDYFKVVFRANAPFKKIPPGVYKISSSSLYPFDVSFQEYIGLSKLENFNRYEANEWRDFSVEGTVTISEQYILKDDSFTAGTINFKAVNKQENITYEFNNGVFSFVNY